MNYLGLFVILLVIISIFFYRRISQGSQCSQGSQENFTFQPMEDIRVPTRSSGMSRIDKQSYQTEGPAPNKNGFYERVVPWDYYQGDQMPTDLKGPYWPSGLRPHELPDYSWRL